MAKGTPFTYINCTLNILIYIDKKIKCKIAEIDYFLDKKTYICYNDLKIQNNDTEECSL